MRRQPIRYPTARRTERTIADSRIRSTARGVEKPRLELQPVGAIVDPFAGCGDPLAGGDDGSMAHDGHQIAVSARLRPEHAEAVLGLVEGDPLDKACENFLSR